MALLTVFSSSQISSTMWGSESSLVGEPSGDMIAGNSSNSTGVTLHLGFMDWVIGDLVGVGRRPGRSS